MKIKGFVGRADFLALEYPCKIEYEGITYENAATLFYALKCNDKGMIRKMARLSPNKARQKVAALKNEDWEANKAYYLRLANSLKFESNPDLKEKLLKTEDAELINEVTHMDNWIGVRSDGSGQNALGKTLMELRREYSK